MGEKKVQWQRKEKESTVTEKRISTVKEKSIISTVIEKSKRKYNKRRQSITVAGGNNKRAN